MKTLINVSNRLPVKIGDTIEKSSGGLVSALGGVEGDYDFKWIGWAGGIVNKAEEKKRLTAELNERLNYFPIFLTKQEIAMYYNGFANTSLWPLLHYFTPYTGYEEVWYDHYLTVNQRFADAVSELAQPGDIVWIQDYHLMLLPSILRAKRPELKIGFFLHTPFPSSEIFRCHPNREQLLQGLLGADLIGFQTFGYLRHFRSTLLRILGIESEMHCITHDNHHTVIGVYPIGINTEKFITEMQSEQFRQYRNSYRKVYNGKKIFLNVERLDYTKGVPRKLDAIGKFLDENQLQDNIVFIFIAVPSRESVKEYNTLLNTVERKVSKINGKHATLTNMPIHFINKPVESFSELCALYSLADVAMVTPLIDGMNLVAKEYLACQQEDNGVLILSEFTGAAQELPHALIVNPYNVTEVVQSLKSALSLTAAEKKRMIQPMKERVLKYDARHWAQSFIRDLNTAIPSEDLPVKTMKLTPDAVLPLITSRNIAFFLDYDGTLAELKRKPADAVPNHEIKKLFNNLQAHPGLDVYLISGRKRDDMDQWFAEWDFNFVAEHGYYHKLRNSVDWVVFDTQADLSWKKQIIDVLQFYTGMTPGSSIEEKTSSVVWHYRNSDPEFGTWKANQLVAELYEMLSNMPVVIHHGKKIVEVSSMQVNKGIALEHFVFENNYDAVLCAGDDETDENMFRLNDDRIISVKVGNEADTAARYRVANPRDFRNFLNHLMEK
jgi:trehalose 6-phosphate synthase/phosphatase